MERLYMLQQHSGGVVQTSGQDTESVAIFACKYDVSDDFLFWWF